MPESMVLAALTDRATIEDMSQIFNVSVPFVVSRLKGLGLIKKENGGALTPPFSNGGQRW